MDILKRSGRGLLLCIFTIMLISCSQSTTVPPTNTIPPDPTTDISTSTVTEIPPSDTPIPPTETPIPPSATSTPLPPTNTPLPPTATTIPTITSTPTSNVEDLMFVHDSDYTYIVYEDISPGTWCPLSPTSDCYWFVYYPGRVYFWYGSGRGCMTISQAAEVVDWYSLCGPWEFKRFEANQTPITDLPLSEEALKANRGPGDYLVGVHVHTGVWRVEGSRYCEWTIYDLMSETLEWNRASGGSLNLVGKAYWVKIGNECSGMTFLHN